MKSTSDFLTCAEHKEILFKQILQQWHATYNNHKTSLLQWPRGIRHCMTRF
jgi:hypothetical protein